MPPWPQGLLEGLGVVKPSLYPLDSREDTGQAASGSLPLRAQAGWLPALGSTSRAVSLYPQGGSAGWRCV